MRFLAEDGVREEFVNTGDDESAEKHGYESFMLKEIYEQPNAVARTIEECWWPERPRARLGLTEPIQELRRMVVLARGTAYHAGWPGAT